jgi:hypothetical protein
MATKKIPTKASKAALEKIIETSHAINEQMISFQ